MSERKQQSENNAPEAALEPSSSQAQHADPARTDPVPPVPIREVGGPRGLEPTRYGDWERNGRCIDF